MLNGSGDDTDDTTLALCVRLLAEHLVGALRRGAAAAAAALCQEKASPAAAAGAYPRVALSQRGGRE